MSTIKACNVDAAELSFSGQPTVLKSGAKMVWLNYRGAPLTIQLPSMKAPFGVSAWCDDKGMVEKYSVDVSFGGENEEVQQAQKLFEDIDQKVLQAALDNQDAWFPGSKKKMTLDVLEALYKPMVKVPNDDKYAPTMKLALPYVNGELGCKVFDAEKKEIDLLSRLSDVKGCQVVAIIQPNVWIAGGKFGCKWKVRQMKVVFRATLNNYAFIEDADDEAGSAGGCGGDDFGSDLEL